MIDISKANLISISFPPSIEHWSIIFNDSNKTCIEGIKIAKKKYRDYSIYFANGGDRNSKTTPELEFCKNNSIETLWGVGGNNKANSSSWILKKWEKEKI